MTKQLFVFLAAFVAAAAAALVVRAAGNDAASVSEAADTPAPHAAPMASMTRTVKVAEPAAAETPAATKEAPAETPVAAKEPEKTEASASEAATVNTRCPVCGMDVDPSVKPADYDGKKVGFGCAKCPPKFAKEPERYGPSALKDEVAPKDAAHAHH